MEKIRVTRFYFVVEPEAMYLVRNYIKQISEYRRLVRTHMNGIEDTPESAYYRGRCDSLAQIAGALGIDLPKR